MIKTLFQCALAALVGLLAWWWFGTVLPHGIAVVFAIAVAIVSIYSVIAGQLKYSLILFGGPVLISWPAGVHIACGIGHLAGVPLTWEVGLGLSWFAPLIAWHVSGAVAEKRDRARDYGGLLCGGIVCYICVVTLYSAMPAAVALAAVGVGAVAWTAGQQLLIPPELERGLRWVAFGAGILAAIYGARWLLF